MSILAHDIGRTIRISIIKRIRVGDRNPVHLAPKGKPVNLRRCLCLFVALCSPPFLLFEHSPDRRSYSSSSNGEIIYDRHQPVSTSFICGSSARAIFTACSSACTRVRSMPRASSPCPACTLFHSVVGGLHRNSSFRRRYTIIRCPQVGVRADGQRVRRIHIPGPDRYFVPCHVKAVLQPRRRYLRLRLLYV